MADSRINLLTSASSSANDDFFVVDGTTNGTRKLSAFNPTFGGDPTITGTLTVNGTSLANGLVVNGNGLALNSAGSASVRFQDAGTSKWWVYKLNADPNLYFRDMVNGRMQMTFVPNATSGTAISYLFSNLVVDSTAASTTTSTGALVVGNGTSGGLGVGGSIVLGANLVSTASDGKVQINGTGNAAGSKEISLQRSDAADAFTIGLTGSAYAGGLSGLGNNEAFVYNSSASALRIFLGTAATNRFDFTSSQFKINPTTISNSTSSGALVVSGGVGVAGAINTGGPITTGADVSLVAIYIPGDSALRAAAGKMYLDTRTVDGGDIVLRPRTNAALTLAAATGNATFTGTLTANGTTFNLSTASANGSFINMDGLAGNFKIITTKTGGVDRWYFGQDTAAESGSNAGSPFFIRALTDAGAVIDTPLTITRAAGGRLTTPRPVTISDSTNSSATSIGALVVSGGVGVAKTIRVGEEVIIDQPAVNPTLLRLYSNGGAGTYTNFAESSMGGQSTNVAFLRWTRGGNEDRELSVHVSNYAGTSIKATTIDPNGNLIQRLNGAAASLTTNSTMTFELTSNTSLKIFVRGSDGTTRSTTLTLA